MNPEQWLSLKWNGGSTMSDRWLNQSKIIHPIGNIRNPIEYDSFWEVSNKRLQRNLGILTPMEKHEIYLQAA